MIVTIDGNIGAGKTTVIQELVKASFPSPHHRLKHVADLEPVEAWEPFLDALYHKKVSPFAFQVRVWLDRCWPKYSPDKMVWMERSPYFTYEVFVPLNKAAIDPLEQQLLKDLYDTALSAWQPDCYVYLRVDPKKAFEQMVIRNRPSEENVPPSYIQQVHDLHEKAISEYKGAKPLIVIDVGSKTPKQIAAEILEKLNL